MVAKIKTFSFIGIEVAEVDVQIKISAGMSSFSIVGLPDKAVGESKERVRAAISSIGIAWPYKKITVNLAPADLQKEGSHFDLAIALGILVEMGVLSKESLANYYCLGELSLDGTITSVSGIISAAVGANERGAGLICPKANSKEALWAGNIDLVAADNLLPLINHLKGEQFITKPELSKINVEHSYPDLADVKGQEIAKRGLEIAAAGGHNILFVGPPGSGKSMLASRLPSILPELAAQELLEINMIYSLNSQIVDGNLISKIPFRDPHQSCSMPAMVGGGVKAKPGEISLAHNGVLFLDELPEFPKQVLDSLRQPLENGTITISRANAHYSYPANFQLIAAMNPCKCGYYGDVTKECKRTPNCAIEYKNKISGPIIDRIDIIIYMGQIDIFENSNYATESSSKVLERVKVARKIQEERYKNETSLRRKINSEISGKILEKYTDIDDETKEILKKSIEKLSVSVRGITRILKVARTIADLDNQKDISKNHILEAISYRRNI